MIIIANRALTMYQALCEAYQQRLKPNADSNVHDFKHYSILHSTTYPPHGDILTAFYSKV